MGKKSIIILAVLIILFNTLTYAFEFPETKVTISDQVGSIITSYRMVPIEVQSSQELKSVKLQINNKGQRTICRNDCWDYRAVKPMFLGVNYVKIILENFNNEVEVHNFKVIVTN